jgi:hypothetical protein
MWNVRNLALSLLIVVGVLALCSQSAVDFAPTPAGAHRARLSVLAYAIDLYVLDEGHLPATLDDLPRPSLPDPGCIGPDERPRDDYRRDPDGVRVDYAIVDAPSLKYRIAIPGHTTKAGAWIPNTHIEESAETAKTPP